jgi:hypothetical protein
MDEKRPYPYSQTFEEWEKGPQMGIEPVHYKDEMFYMGKPTWTKQTIEY